MSTSRFIVVLIAVLALSAQAKLKFTKEAEPKAIVNQNPTVPGINQTVAMYYLTAFRGLLQGYEMGLYANSSIVVSQSCFGETTLQTIT